MAILFSGDGKTLKLGTRGYAWEVEWVEWWFEEERLVR